MIKIVMVVPFDEMRDLAMQVYEEHTAFARQEHPDNEKYEFAAVRAATTAEVFDLKLDADVIIARGATAYDLKRSNFHIPVVEQVISGEDIIGVLYQLKQQYGNVPAAMLGTDNMVLGVDDIAKQIGVDLSIYRLAQSTEEEIYRNVNQAVQDGKKVILGGMRGCIYARNLGAGHMLLTSGRNSIWNAITAAKQLGTASRHAKEQALMREAMVDHAFEGLIALDHQGRITALNRSAQIILDITPGNWCIGMPIREVLRSPRIANLCMRPETIADEIIEYRNTHISFKKISVILRGEAIGSVLTFLNAVQIQETEGRLRGKIHHKGHTAKYTFPDIIGESAPLREAITIADAFARTTSNILITGESGTGKELFAQSIHNASARSGQPFVAVNCAAIPENLLESELFGYVSGAFTGANREGKAGLFEIAHNGTIFLDEISEMPLTLQSRLLRVLQEREIMRLGHDKVIPIDVRILAATNKDLSEQVSKGLFREDLFYRLFVLGLTLPPLRERPADIGILAQAFINEFCMQLDRLPLKLSDAAGGLLETQPWPGNIRQLRNVCERTSVLCPPEEAEISGAQMARILSYGVQEPAPPAAEGEYTGSPEALLEVLNRAGGNKTLAAQMLGISRVTLWRHLKKLDLI